MQERNRMRDHGGHLMSSLNFYPTTEVFHVAFSMEDSPKAPKIGPNKGVGG